MQYSSFDLFFLFFLDARVLCVFIRMAGMGQSEMPASKQLPFPFFEVALLYQAFCVYFFFSDFSFTLGSFSGLFLVFEKKKNNVYSGAHSRVATLIQSSFQKKKCFIS